MGVAGGENPLGGICGLFGDLLMVWLVDDARSEPDSSVESNLSGILTKEGSHSARTQ